MSVPEPLASALRDAPPGAICVGYSGGVDSTVLLHALQAGGFEPRALHIDHGLQSQSAAWADHCRAFCAALGVPIAVLRVQVDQIAALGPEGAARAARHAAFAAELREGETLALAHHRDDQAETVLLRLLHGAGIEGLGGMRRLRPFARGRLWRPWLGIAREDLVAYARRHGLAWIEDPSNASPRHAARNHLRHAVLPALQTRWPDAVRRIAAAAARVAEEADVLDGLARDTLAALLEAPFDTPVPESADPDATHPLGGRASAVAATAEPMHAPAAHAGTPEPANPSDVRTGTPRQPRTRATRTSARVTHMGAPVGANASTAGTGTPERATASTAGTGTPERATALAAGARTCGRTEASATGTLDAAGLRLLAPALRRAVIGRWLDTHGLPRPPPGAWNELDALLDAREDAAPLWRWNGAEVRRYRDALYAMRPLREAAAAWSMAWTGHAVLELPEGFGRLELDPCVTLSPALRVQPRRGGERLAQPGVRRELRTLLQDLGLPPWQRERLPLLLEADGTVVAAGDLALAPAFAARLAALGTRLRWHRGAD